MPPPRRYVSTLGEALRAARQALQFDQLALAQRIPVSSRQISRWENGTRPDEWHAGRLFQVLSAAPAPIVDVLADALGIELPEDEPIAPPVPLPPPPPPLPPVPARPTDAALRASFDAIILSVAEDRDVLPRHLRAFAVALFKGADRLGVSAKEGAELVAMADGAPSP